MIFQTRRAQKLLWLVASLLSLCGAETARSTTPTQADIAKIYNIEKEPNQSIDVRFYRQGECDNKTWCPVKGAGDYLKKKDYLQTGEISRADLALMNQAQQRYSEVLFWQQEGSRSKFMPQAGTCHFQVDLGGFLYAHPHQGGDPGCEKIVSKNALVIPNGTALFIIGSAHDTVVGVLSNRPNYTIKVQHLQSDKAVDLQAGEYAKAYDDGRLVKDAFDLKDFYRRYPLGLGLGPEQKDEDYVKKQLPEIQEILRKIRVETVEAVNEQSLNVQFADSPIVPTRDPDTGGSNSGNGGVAPATDVFYLLAQ